MHGIHTQVRAWSVMLHGAIFPRFTAQDVLDSGRRGASGFGAPNWFMATAEYDVTPGSRLILRAMISLDRLTEQSGYPLLFQTGETYKGRPLTDWQHPHDLFAELAVSYQQDLGQKGGFFVYLGYPAEPALGPPVFMHRASAQHNPDAPLGHHWQDATHICFGVATVGIRYGIFKLGGSIFTGREPNENRFDFESPRFDSYGIRLSANPTPKLALQVSRAFLNSPEVLHPLENQWRTTASVMFAQPLAGRRNWATTAVWGLNQLANKDELTHVHNDGTSHLHTTSGHGTAHSVLLESDLTLERQAFYTRLEWVQKASMELGILFPNPARIQNIKAVTFGTAREVVQYRQFNLLLGVQGSLYGVPDNLHSIYGRAPMSAQIYLHLRPTQMQGMDH